MPKNWARSMPQPRADFQKKTGIESDVVGVAVKTGVVIAAFFYPFVQGMINGSIRLRRSGPGCSGDGQRVGADAPYYSGTRPLRGR
jgi:hypothetical protein